MRTRSLAVLVVALVVVLAGCTGTMGTPDATADGPTNGGGASTNDESAARQSVNFYVSDERNDIDDFASLNVTITSVGFHRVGNGSNESGDGEWITRDVGEATVDLTELQGAKATRIATFDVPNGTYDKVFLYVGDVDGTLNGTGESVRVKLPSGKLHVDKGFSMGENASIDFVFDVSVHEAGNSGKYILKPVVAESGTDVEIDDVDDPGKSGDAPGKSGDTPGKSGDAPGKSGDAPGKSGDAPGKSGDAPGKSENQQDDDADEDDEADREDDQDDDPSERSLNATFVGSVAPGGEATVAVELDGEPVENAQVFVNGDRVGKTDADGRLTIPIPEGDEVEVLVTAKGAEVEIEREFEDQDED